MKRMMAFIVLLVILLAYILVSGKATTESQKVYYRYNMHGFFKRVDANMPVDRLVFIGDSQIQGLATSTLSASAFNLGIGTDTIAGVTKRQNEYQSIKTAHCIFIHIGVNDLLNKMSPQQAIGEYKLLLDALPKDRKLILSQLLPVAEVSKKLQGKSDQIKTFNRHLSELIQGIEVSNTELENVQQSTSNWFLFSAQNALAGPDEQLLDELHLGDGLHLNPKGNAIWLAEIKAFLAELDCLPLEPIE